MKPRVLLIEDNANNRYLASFILEQLGLHVIHAENGRDGVAMARAERPDLILLDIQMPEMDGYEAGRLLLDDPVTASIPIIVVTSFAMPGDKAKAMAMGFADYIEKPFDPEVFSAKVRTHLPPSGTPPT